MPQSIRLPNGTLVYYQVPGIPGVWEETKITGYDPETSKFILIEQRVSSDYSLSPIDKATSQDAWPTNAMVK